MRNPKKNTLLAFLVGLLILCLLPMGSLAALVVQTEVASGKIVQLNADHSVKLDNGMSYRPSRPGLTVDVPAGAPVTLRYYVESSGDKVFFEYAPGLDALAPLPPYVPDEKERKNK